MMQPVTDVRMKVTDTRVLAQLAASRIDPAFVEFRDYDRTRPYGKLYVDRKSNQRILVSSGLPMVRGTDGSRLTPGWELSGEKYYLKNNLFEGYATPGGEYHISVVNDQPTGPIAGDEAHWSPVLKVGGEVIKPQSVTILETDPENENYHDNVIEWDYGVCQRRIRVVEGRFRGSWIFGSDPGADVRIEYNQTGKLAHNYGRAYGGKGGVVEVQMPVKECEFVSATTLATAVYPVVVGDTGVYYPDANPENATVDGWTQVYDQNLSWSSLVGAGGMGKSDNGTYFRIGIYSGSTADKWAGLYRIIFLFDSSGIDDAIISAATIRTYSFHSIELLNIDPTSVICESNPISNTALAAEDHQRSSNIAFSNEINEADLASSGYNTYTLNAAGIANINKTGVSKFGCREGKYDMTGNAPTWSGATMSYMSWKSAEAGAGYKPTLTATYALAAESMGAQLININQSGVTTYKAGNVR